jgi:hypothetical protein
LHYLATTSCDLNRATKKRCRAVTVGVKVSHEHDLITGSYRSVNLSGCISKGRERGKATELL